MGFEDVIFEEMNGHSVEEDKIFVKGYNQALDDLYKLDYCTECEKQGDNVDCYYCRVNNAQQWFLEQLKKQK